MEYAPIIYSDPLGANGVYFLNRILVLSLEVKCGNCGGHRARRYQRQVGRSYHNPFRNIHRSEKVLAPARGFFVVPHSVDARTASMLNIKRSAFAVVG